MMDVLNVLSAAFSITCAVVLGARCGWYLFDNWNYMLIPFRWLYRHTLGRFFRKKD